MDQSLLPPLHRPDAHFYQAVLGFGIWETSDGVGRFVGIVLR